MTTQPTSIVSTVWRVLAWLVFLSLAGCAAPWVATPASPIPAVPASSRLETGIPTVVPSIVAPPQMPVIVTYGGHTVAPPGEVTVIGGKSIAVRAGVPRAKNYIWTFSGRGTITDPTKPSVIYTAPLTGGKDILLVKAANEGGESLEAVLIITIQPVVAAPIDRFGEPSGWISCTKEWHSLDPGSGIVRTGQPQGCYTGADCFRFTAAAGTCGTVLWQPDCMKTNRIAQCQPAAGTGAVTAANGSVCTSRIAPPAAQDVLAGSCSINALTRGNLESIARLTFWARGEKGGEIVTFCVGSANLPPTPGHCTGRQTLSHIWTPYTIDLRNVDFTNTAILFSWHVNAADNPQGVTLYLDDIQFEGAGVLGAPLISEAQPAAEQPTPAAVRHLADLLAGVCWVAYSPTHYDPVTSPVRWPSANDIRADLQVLHAAGFKGLVTYTSNFQDPAKPGQLQDIAGLAEEAGFDGLLVGVWDPTDEQELAAAVQAGRSPVVAGYVVGNEGLGERYSLADLTAAMARLRSQTGKPATTSEQVGDYYENSPLWAIGDWVFPNAHPYFAGQRTPDGAVAWTSKVFDSLDKLTGKPVIFKEVGLPSGDAKDVSEAGQAQYYRLLRESSVAYVVFEAFDAPWKHLHDANPDGTESDPEPHWGIFTSSRTPKAAAAGICGK